jgi:hypothetical protein
MTEQDIPRITTYQSGLIDPELKSSIASAGLTTRTVGRVFTELIRMLFMSADNFQVQEMRFRKPAMIWDPDPAKSKIRIVRDVDWQPQTDSSQPQIVIRPSGTQWVKNNNAAELDAPEITPENATWVNNQLLGRILIWATSKVPDECIMLGDEIASYLAAFAVTFAKEWGFFGLQVVTVGPPAHIKEQQGLWGVATTIGVIWECTSVVSKQGPPITVINQTIVT